MSRTEAQRHRGRVLPVQANQSGRQRLSCLPCASASLCEIAIAGIRDATRSAPGYRGAVQTLFASGLSSRCPGASWFVTSKNRDDDASTTK